MDNTDLVSGIVDQLAKVDHGTRALISWYMFQDKRPGSITDRFHADAAEFMKFKRLYEIQEAVWRLDATERRGQEHR